MKNTILRKNNGITLIALVVTIIVLIILAGVSLNLVLGQNGIIQRAKDASKLNSENVAMEKLTITLTEIYAEKQLNNEFSENDVNAILTKEGYEVNGDIVIVDGWQFEIDRYALKIINSLGKGTKNEEIKIELSQYVSNDYTTSTVTVQITYNAELKEININVEKINPIPKAVDGVYTITKEIRENKTIGVLVKDIEDNYNIGNILVVDLTKDMEIRTAEDLADFRDKVNAGRTFEGRTVILAQDIDLSSVCGEKIGSWEPIGNYGTNTTHMFKGTFDGRNNAINNIFINTTENVKALFGKIENATVKNVKIKGNIKAGKYVSGITAIMTGTSIIQNCKNYVQLESNITDSSNNCYNGGIVGWMKCNEKTITAIVENCDNYGNIKSNLSLNGGIIGEIYSNSDNAKTILIKNCNNYGKITTSLDNTGGIIGNLWKIQNITIENCINYGEVLGKNNMAGILGNSHISSNITINRCENNNNITAENYNAGGIVGILYSSSNISISECYNLKTILAKTDTAAGIIGSINASTLKVSDCYNIGNISNNHFVSGILGIQFQGTRTACSKF